MWRKMLNIFSRQGALRKRGFGIVEVMISIVVLGFLYVALLNLQTSNDAAVLRMRGRDGAVEVAQEILDSLNSARSGVIASKFDKDTTIVLDERVRKWDRALGGTTTIKYTPELTVKKTSDYVAQNNSNYENEQHVYAKQVNICVKWKFKSTTQSINVSGVIQ